MKEKAEKKTIIAPAQGLLILIEEALKTEQSVLDMNSKGNDCSDSLSSKSQDSINTSLSTVNFFSSIKSDSDETIDMNQPTLEMNSESLIKLYVSGARNRVELETMSDLLRTKLPHHYFVSKELDVINNDPTRRYFETYLAASSLEHGLKQLPKDDLQSHQAALFEKLISVYPWCKNEEFLATHTQHRALSDMLELRQHIKDRSFLSNLDEPSWEKITLLANCWIDGYLFNRGSSSLRLDIYDDADGIFGDKHRGRSDRRSNWGENRTQYSQNLGILKSTMPTPAFSKVQSKATQVGKILSDAGTCIPNTTWVNQNLSHFVHPFVNSISGTMLVHLRCLTEIKHVTSLEKLEEKDKLFDGDARIKLALYLRLFSALLIYVPGGHSWYELIAPIELKEVQEEFNDIAGFNALNMETIVYKDNLEAIHEAIQETIEYNRTILARQAIQDELKTKTNTNKDASSEPPSDISLRC